MRNGRDFAPLGDPHRVDESPSEIDSRRTVARAQRSPVVDTMEIGGSVRECRTELTGSGHPEPSAHSREDESDIVESVTRHAPDVVRGEPSERLED